MQDDGTDGTETDDAPDGTDGADASGGSDDIDAKCAEYLKQYPCDKAYLKIVGGKPECTDDGDIDNTQISFNGDINEGDTISCQGSGQSGTDNGQDGGTDDGVDDSSASMNQFHLGLLPAFFLIGGYNHWF